MREMIEALNEKQGKEVNIYTEHKLFGKQHICVDKFVPETEIGIGFRFKDQVIYIEKNDIAFVEIYSDSKEIIIKGGLMTIRIV